MLVKTGAFKDVECTCECGNKHEFYGGIGYETVFCEGYSDGNVDGGSYVHIVKCKQCGKKSEFIDK
ncbi:hypothetical protein [Paenibacillus alvei]|uniref:Uncharacterized protein n=1 Tax=Paenibacillus alvei TaxID=44250 RepID=A0ABT4H2H3_PAEAL|nr:hypothetical protein [Paenibacillus alvei]MCY9763180.1 hypothetical protein [Paenibacillus alvei]